MLETTSVLFSTQPDLGNIFDAFPLEKNHSIQMMIIVNIGLVATMANKKCLQIRHRFSLHVARAEVFDILYVKLPALHIFLPGFEEKKKPGLWPVS